MTTNRKTVNIWKCTEILLNTTENTEVRGVVSLLFGIKIKTYLDDNGIRYTHVSEKTGIPMDILSLLLNGKRKVEATEYFAICDALNVPLTKFADDAVSA